MIRYILRCLIIFCFSACKNDKHEIIISATPSAKCRTTPNQDGSELFSLDTNTKIDILGISSHKDKIAIGGVNYDENWYLVQKTNAENKVQGWVYGGCISFPKKYIKPTFVSIMEKDLIKKSVEIAPCFESFDIEGNPICGTDCGIGTIYFLDEKAFLSANYCMGGGTDYCLGLYKITRNELQLSWSNVFYNTGDEEQEDDNAKQLKAPSIIKKEKQVQQVYTIHNYDNKPIFIQQIEEETNVLGVPKSYKTLDKESIEAIEKLKSAN